MFPAASAVSAAIKPAQPVDPLAALRSSQQQAAETARASAGEASAANIRTETAQAVKAAEQSAVAARLRDQEKAEHSERHAPERDSPTGPPPTFEESPLERQARLAFEPPEAPARTVEAPSAPENRDDAPPTEAATAPESDPIDPPPTPRERAELSFAETRAIAEPRDKETVNLGL